MSKKRSDLLSKELVLLSIRVNGLKAEKRQIALTIASIKKLLKGYDNAEQTLRNLNDLLIGIDIEIYKRHKRMRKIVAELFKRSGKIFEESPKDIKPGTRDILDGYISLTEIKEDTYIPNIFILSTGQIMEKGSPEANALLKESYLEEREFNMLKSYLVLTNEISYPRNFNSLSIVRDKQGLAKAILSDNHKVNKLKKEL